LCGKRDVAVVAQNLFLECAGACTIDGLRGPVADVNILDVDLCLRGGEISYSTKRSGISAASFIKIMVMFYISGSINPYVFPFLL